MLFSLKALAQTVVWGLGQAREAGGQCPLTLSSLVSGPGLVLRAADHAAGICRALCAALLHTGRLP